jgi:ribose transport system permease protein
VNKILGITLLLVAICVITAIQRPVFIGADNTFNLLRWTSLFGILSIGVAFVIMTGGIDLSIGSVVGLVGSILALLLSRKGWSVPAALGACMAVSLIIGLTHGLLITKLKLQPFVVTLCGLMFYRSMARFITDDDSLGFGNKFDSLRNIAIGDVGLEFTIGSITFFKDYRLPYTFFIMAGTGIIAIILLRKTVFGRYVLAIGRNEEAAIYSGIRTHRTVIAVYVICSLLAGLGGILFSLDVNSVQPVSFGAFFELYAIAAAVLGGCSLRGGEGSIIGVIIGAAVMRVLYNAINILGIPTHLEFAIIGLVILAGVTVDELVKRWVAKRQLKKRAL